MEKHELVLQLAQAQAGLAAQYAALMQSKQTFQQRLEGMREPLYFEAVKGGVSASGFENAVLGLPDALGNEAVGREMAQVTMHLAVIIRGLSSG